MDHDGAGPRQHGLGSEHSSADQRPDMDQLRAELWKALDDSPFVMLQLVGDAESTAPMTAQLDPDANHRIWFYTTRSGRFAVAGPVTAIFASKDHELFAHFEGDLVEETDPARIDKHWSNMVEAWYAHGKDDPDLLMLRMELGKASIWSANELGIIGTVKMMLGLDVREDAAGGYGEGQL